MAKTEKLSRETWFIRETKTLYASGEYGGGPLGGAILDYDYIYDRTKKRALCDASRVVVDDRKLIKGLESIISRAKTTKTDKVQRLNLSGEQVETLDTLFRKAKKIAKEIREAAIVAREYELKAASAEREMEKQVRQEIQKVTRRIIFKDERVSILAKK